MGGLVPPSSFMNQELLQKFLDCNDTDPYIYGGMFRFFQTFVCDASTEELTNRLRNLCKKDGIEVIYDDSLIDELDRMFPITNGPTGPSIAKDCLGLAWVVDIRPPETRSLSNKIIYLRKPFSKETAFSVLLHEYCHVSLGHLDNAFTLETVETEAEIVNCLVSFELGIDISKLSFQYVNHFAKLAGINKTELVKRERLVNLIEKLSKALQ